MSMPAMNSPVLSSMPFRPHILIYRNSNSRPGKEEWAVGYRGADNMSASEDKFYDRREELPQEYQEAMAILDMARDEEGLGVVRSVGVVSGWAWRLEVPE